MKFVRLFLILVVIYEAAAEVNSKEPPNRKGCSDKADGACTKSDEPKSRQKRVVTLPNLTALTLQSRLIVPQPPVGLYLVWMRARFFVRTMFTESTAS